MSLFSGIGGIELGLAAAGIADVVGFCESYLPAQTVLRARFEGAPLHEDVRDITSLGGADIITAGFPCTDFSQAGLTQGIDGLASGLVRHVLDLVAKDRPQWVLLENVPNMLHLARGAAISEIVRRLESAGYDWAYRVVDSRAFGLPQRRRRVYLLASIGGDPAAVLFRGDHSALRIDGGVHGARRDAFGFYWTEGNRGLGWAVDALPPLKGSSGFRIPSPPAAWVPAAEPGRRIVRPKVSVGEVLQGLPAGWTRHVDLRDRWKLVGNAVSAPAARWVGEGISGLGEAYLDSLERQPHIDGSAWPSAAHHAAHKTWDVAISDFPELPRGRGRHLGGVLKRYGCEPLSLRATDGFRGRLVRSNLSYDPEFMRDLALHVEVQAGR